MELFLWELWIGCFEGETLMICDDHQVFFVVSAEGCARFWVSEMRNKFCGYGDKTHILGGEVLTRPKVRGPNGFQTTCIRHKITTML